MGVQIPHPEQKCTIPVMSITKAQLDAINQGILDRLGSTRSQLEPMGTSVLAEVMQNVAQKIVDELEVSLREKKLVASKNLLQSIDPTDMQESQNGVTINIKMARYWEDVEFGTKPGKRVSVDALVKWIQAKGLPVRAKKGMTIDQARWSYAEAIAGKIYKKGTIKRFGYKGSGFIASTLSPTAINIIAQSIGDAMGRQISIFVSTEAE
jgi:hypothetical protein